MKTKLLLWCGAGLLVALTRASAATHYVDAASTNAVPPFTNWANAAAVIQDAVDAAAPGDEIVVTNGVYQTGARAVHGMSNRVAVTKAVRVESINGPAETTIVGYQVPGTTNGAAAVRCAYLTNGAVLSGFTLTNGATQTVGDPAQNSLGGGVWCVSTGAVVTNCVLTGNSAYYEGGGAYKGTLDNCVLTGNSSFYEGGGAFLSTLHYCVLTGNSAPYGGGANSSALNNCTLTGNWATYDGGGAYSGTLNNCTLTGNAASYGAGANGGTLNNCVLTGNAAYSVGGGAYSGTLNNCIVYYNAAPTGPNYYGSDDSFITFNNCCTTPDPGSGVGNITNAPLFVDTNGWSNLRLQSNSPCINAGNNGYVTTSTDLDGRPRVVGGTVDIGAYEWQGTTRYVSAASTNPIAPYSSWASAAVTVQDAVDAAAPGDEIVVTNGVYQTGARAVYGMSNRVAVTKPVTVRSVNGPAYTSIVGHGPRGDSAVRCVYLTNGAVLSGFTLTNGATQISGDVYTNQSGGGLWCSGPSAIGSNCVLTGNAAATGGGVLWGGLRNCTLTNNTADSGGGARESTLSNCTLTGNSAGAGGGAFAGTLNNCTLTSNSATLGGGAGEATLNSCTLVGNRGYFAGGGASGGTLNGCTLIGNWGDSGGGADEVTLNNCTLTGNSAYYGGGAYGCSLNHCTLTGNWADQGGGVMYGSADNCTLTGNSAPSFEGAGGGAASAALNNCIIYHNTAADFGENYNGCTLNYSCTTPDPGSGVGNITNAPLFVDTNGWSNLRLQSNSPCINAGNNAYVAAATDLDGFPRIAGGTVDIGAYEFQSPASTISYAWLQQSGLPTDGSADDVDTDHDGLNNWQEWMAGTDPTNALSALRLAPPVVTPTNVILTWTSVTNRTYTLEQAANLGGAPAFSVLRSNLAGLPGIMSWTDTNAPVSSPRFYQLRVSP